MFARINDSEAHLMVRKRVLIGFVQSFFSFTNVRPRTVYLLCIGNHKRCYFVYGEEVCPLDVPVFAVKCYTV